MIFLATYKFRDIFKRSYFLEYHLAIDPVEAFFVQEQSRGVVLQ